MNIANLPAPIPEYVDTTNAFDLSRLVATFDDRALVNDHRCEFVGKEQIRSWAAREIVGDHVTLKVVGTRVCGDSVALTAEVDGDFDKSGLPQPLVLALYFAVSNGQIVQLVIVNNKPAK